LKISVIKYVIIIDVINTITPCCDEVIEFATTINPSQPNKTPIFIKFKKNPFINNCM
jgi:hypothetical protein